MGSVTSILEAAADENVSVATVLRRCLIYANETGDDDLRQWVNRELNGYAGEDELPSYRVIDSYSVGDLVGGGFIHKKRRIDTSGLGEPLSKRAHTLWIREGVDALSAAAEQDGLVSSWSAHDLYMLNKRDEDLDAHWQSAKVVVPIGCFRGILGAIRNRVLNHPFKDTATINGQTENLARSTRHAKNPSDSGPTPAIRPPEAEPSTPVRVFIAYPRADKRHREKLVKHLGSLKRQGIVETWYDGEIVAGQEWENQILEKLESADVIILLISADFIDSDYCYMEELKRAKERHERGVAVVIPVMVRHIDFHGEWFATLQMLPEDARAVTDWSNRDKAWTDVAKGVRKAIDKLRGIAGQA